MENHDPNENQNQNQEGRQRPNQPYDWLNSNFLNLSQIVRDLGLQSMTPAVPEVPHAPEEAPAEAVREEEEKKEDQLPFDSFWRVCDEEISWTEALVSKTCPDGLTEPLLWQIYHQEAEAVLNGDKDAYLAVLDAARPMERMKPYASGFEIAVEDAEHALCAFDGNPVYMHRSLPELRKYLSGMALRLGRSLLALLPLSRVTVIGRYQGESLLVVTLEREQLRNRRFTVGDPEEVIRGMGAVFGAMDDDPEAE